MQNIATFISGPWHTSSATAAVKLTVVNMAMSIDQHYSALAAAGALGTFGSGV